ncbi:MAG: thioredoxin family protein [Bacteroidota bacterium]
MRNHYLFIQYVFVLSILKCAPLFAQESASVRWLTFEQLEDSLETNPRPVLIDFYTDWCTYCRKMDQVVFTNQEVVNMLNEQYYAVRFDAETASEVIFGGQKFVNHQIGKSRTPTHELAQLLASRAGRFAPPVIVILAKDFRVTARYFEYLNSHRLIKALEK